MLKWILIFISFMGVIAQIDWDKTKTFCGKNEYFMVRLNEPNCNLQVDTYSSIEDCRCIPGFIRNHGSCTNKCVCDRNETTIRIGKYKRCICSDGYVLSYENRCVSKDLCPKENEIWADCYNVCPPGVFCIIGCLGEGCYCKKGYERDSFNNCVAISPKP